MTGIRQGAVVIVALLLAACSTPAAQAPPTSLEDDGALSEQFALPRGYLDPEALPDGLALLPPPPAEGSAAKAADLEAFEQAMQASPERQALAASDAVLEWGQIIRTFEESLDTSLTDGSKPHTEMLLQRSIADGAVSTLRAKNHYDRVRLLLKKGSAVARRRTRKCSEAMALIHRATRQSAGCWRCC